MGCAALAALAGGAASGSPPAPAPAPTPEPVPDSRFRDEIAVRLVPVVVRVVDGAGNPVLGLTPGDFRVRVGRREVPVAAVDWEGAAAAPPAAPPAAGDTAGAPQAPQQAPPAGVPGKLVVVFVEADNNSPPRVRGHLRTLPFTRKILDALSPADSVAVVSFDSHLKLWQDFTRDREAIPGVIYQAIHFGGRPPEILGECRHRAAASPPAQLAGCGPAGAGDGDGETSPSLARSFDFSAALDAASPERALELTAEALSALPGEKEMVFLGWGLGSFSIMGSQASRAFAAAAHILAAARVSVFVLDVTEADFHNLEVGLQAIADATGGTYEKTYRLPDRAVRQLAQTMSGYYVLSLDAAALPAAGGDVEVRLRRHRGSVLLRSTSIPAGIGGR